ncbi:dynein axonemal light chain 1-like isoform X2 [Mercenaria mercenaria]|uniref:dynein axonemal light chain 1-like isoform X2 n=1 Tax=Mercenaria mercenaria TaxID=6596 RepID=UPI001E1DBE8B|nr:dynein axonemal light chain 1-like isoform X2 [Mercenaria mercenaria]
MAKATTIKEAITRFEEAEKCKANDSKKVMLYGQIPPIEKMDASLSTLGNCEQLALSTNVIEKIANLNGLKNLKILSLARNSIKSLTGLEAVGDTLEELWISYNNIEKLKGINVLKKLKVLYIRQNNVKDMGEFMKLADLPCMIELGFIGNPLGDSLSEASQENYTDTITKKLPKLKRLDGFTVIREEQEEED